MSAQNGAGRFLKNGAIGLLSLAISAASFYSACTARKVQIVTDNVTSSLQQKAKDDEQDGRLDASRLWEENHDAEVGPRIMHFDAFMADWPEYRGFIRADHELLARMEERHRAMDQRITDLHRFFAAQGMPSTVKPPPPED